MCPCLPSGFLTPSLLPSQWMHLSHPMHDTSPFKSSSFIIKYMARNPNAINYFLGSQNMHILVVKFLQSIATSALLGRNILLGTRISKSLSLCSSFVIWEYYHTKTHNGQDYNLTYWNLNVSRQRTGRQKNYECSRLCTILWMPFEVFTVMLQKIWAFWDVILCQNIPANSQPQHKSLRNILLWCKWTNWNHATTHAIWHACISEECISKLYRKTGYAKSCLLCLRGE
jgi:hypothetical protein